MGTVPGARGPPARPLCHGHGHRERHGRCRAGGHCVPGPDASPALPLSQFKAASESSLSLLPANLNLKFWSLSSTVGPDSESGAQAVASGPSPILVGKFGID